MQSPHSVTVRRNCLRPPCQGARVRIRRIAKDELARSAHVPPCMRLSLALLASTVALASVLATACGGSAGSSAGRASDPTKSGVVPVSAADERKGVSLTGDHPYDEEHDPSGWGGKSELPGAVGGGPVATPVPTPAPPQGPQGAPAQQAEPTAPAATAPSAPPAAPPSKADAKKPPTKAPAPAPKADPKAPAPPAAPPSKDLVPDSKELVP